MQSATAEIIFYIIVFIVTAYLFASRCSAEEECVEMTWTKKRDIARTEKQWNK